MINLVHAESETRNAVEGHQRFPWCSSQPGIEILGGVATPVDRENLPHAWIAPPFSSSLAPELFQVPACNGKLMVGILHPRPAPWTLPRRKTRGRILLRRVCGELQDKINTDPSFIARPIFLVTSFSMFLLRSLFLPAFVRP